MIFLFCAIILVFAIIINIIINNKKIKEIKKEIDFSLQVSNEIEFIFYKYLELTKKDFEIFNKYKNKKGNF
ncbi:MAG: hypothetical protein RSB67_00645 [Clostridia bacterium]